MLRRRAARPAVPQARLRSGRSVATSRSRPASTALARACAASRAAPARVAAPRRRRRRARRTPAPAGRARRRGRRGRSLAAAPARLRARPPAPAPLAELQPAPGHVGAQAALHAGEALRPAPRRGARRTAPAPRRGGPAAPASARAGSAPARRATPCRCRRRSCRWTRADQRVAALPSWASSWRLPCAGQGAVVERPARARSPCGLRKREGRPARAPRPGPCGRGHAAPSRTGAQRRAAAPLKGSLVRAGRAGALLAASSPGGSLSGGQALQRFAVLGARSSRSRRPAARGAGARLVPGLAVDARLLEPVAHELLVVARRVGACRRARSPRPARSARSRASAPRPSASACRRRRGRTRTWCRR